MTVTIATIKGKSRLVASPIVVILNLIVVENLNVETSTKVVAAHQSQSRHQKEKIPGFFITFFFSRDLKTKLWIHLNYRHFSFRYFSAVTN